VAAKPPLGLSVVAIAADGSETIWWSGDRRAYNRPQQGTFRTRVGEGFSDGSFNLVRRIDRDWNDLSLYNTILVFGDDGRTAYEARVGGTPRSSQNGHSISVQTAGWMAHAADAKFRQVFVDAQPSSWNNAGLTGQSSQNASFGDMSWSTQGAGLICSLPASLAAAASMAEAWWVAPPGVTIGKVIYAGADSNMPGTWEAPQITFGNGEGSHANVQGATFDSAFHTATPNASTYVAAMFRVYNQANAATPTQPAYRKVSGVGVYGSHGLATHAISGMPDGLYASDMIVWIAQNYCPKLDTSGVQATTLAIPHATFTDRTTPHDAFLVLNGPHGYELAVWEGKKLTFRPYDLSSADWQVRLDQDGVDVSFQGDTTQDLANYCIVEFDDLTTGRRGQVGPSDDSGLQDTSVSHPANAHGLNVELTVGLTFPTIPAVAIAFGKSYLAEFNRPKDRGQITVQGHILDAAGHWQQAWCPRYGQTISVVDAVNDDPRLITETSYDMESHTMTISTDNGEVNLLEAVVDYIKTSLTAQGISN
jgi:hypothetical protein